MIFLLAFLKCLLKQYLLLEPEAPHHYDCNEQRTNCIIPQKQQLLLFCYCQQNRAALLVDLNYVWRSVQHQANFAHLEAIEATDYMGDVCTVWHISP